ncbi:Ig-like domain-containing protein [Arthrobacter sp. BE255]|uniref:Ig-like domain-containing protein n=1 Tax=Arthrobacter sp. BE255 TaxID=2817721 RepID=UPI002859BCEE|nr:Ig-like domain-containing protein [Arthrobacter sp. BE255]MDR7161848.1 hypothetical protein [Arthrobacter sp. BE255]
MSRPSQTPRRSEFRPGRHARIAGVVAAALVISWGGPAANAFWQTLGSNAGTAKADSIPAVAAPAASVSSGAAAVSWAQGTTAAGRPVAGYTVARYSAGTGGTKVAAAGGCAGTVAALTCTEANLPGGTWYYTVTPVLGAWAGLESARSGGAVGDSTPPAAPTIVAPSPVNIANAASAPVSGTAEALSSVTVTVKDAGAAHTASQTVTTNGSGQWTAANFDLTTFTDGTITYSAVATDAAGNASAPGTATSTKDTVAPTAKVTLVNSGTQGTAEKGDTVTIQFSKPMNLPSICSTWVTGQQPPEASANGDVVVTITGTNLTVSRTLAGCTFNIGTVSLGATYANSGNLTFEGNGGNASKIAWNNSNQTLTITLGQRAGSAKPGVGTSSPTVAPPPGVKDLNGNQAVSAPPAAASRF